MTTSRWSFSSIAAAGSTIVALHDTTLGPALGGCRMWPYATEADAITDVLRLSKGMTFKAAMADLPYGGGKGGDHRRSADRKVRSAVPRARPLHRPSRRPLLHGRGCRHRHAGHGLGGRGDRVVWAARGGGSGDPSPVTARGVWFGIRAAVRHKLQRDELAGVRVAIQGLGHVGSNLARLLAEDGARLIVADLDQERRARGGRAGAKAVGVDAILSVECDVLAPCALGGVLNDDTIPRLARSWPARPTISCSRTDTVRRCMRAASCTRRIT